MSASLAALSHSAATMSFPAGEEQGCDSRNENAHQCNLLMTAGMCQMAQWVVDTVVLRATINGLIFIVTFKYIRTPIFVAFGLYSKCSEKKKVIN